MGRPRLDPPRATLFNAMGALGRLWLEHRKRLAPAVALLAVAVIGSVLVGAMPRETVITFELGPDHGSVTDAHIAYTLDGETVKGVRFHYAEGAPERLGHTVELSPGRYQVEVSLTGPEASRQVRRPLEVPAEGLVRIALFDAAVALRGAP